MHLCDVCMSIREGVHVLLCGGTFSPLGVFRCWQAGFLQEAADPGSFGSVHCGLSLLEELPCPQVKVELPASMLPNSHTKDSLGTLKY